MLPLVVVVGADGIGKIRAGHGAGESFSRGNYRLRFHATLSRRETLALPSRRWPSVGEVPHHLIDVLDPSEVATAGGYRELALAALEDLRERELLPILTVGTGLYMRALLEGLADLPLRSEEVRARLRRSARKHGAAHLHGVLRRMDREAAEKIAPTDEQKLIRAIEVCVLTRKPITEVHRAGRNPLQGWRVLKIGLMPEREELYRRIAARTDAMIAGGWLDEVRGLLAAGIAAGCKNF